MKRTKAFIFVVASLSVFSATSLGLGPSSQQPITLQEKTAKADLIVVGKVTDVKSGWTEPKTIPSTFVSVSIEEGVKGYLTSSEITIEVPGGSDGKVLSIVLGMPEFHKGERVLLFLIRDLHSDKYYLVHGGYGKYRVGPDNEMADMSKTLPEFLSEIRQYISK